MIERLFVHYLQQSDRVRPGYYSSLGVPAPNFYEVLQALHGEKLELLQVIYGTIAGTRRNIANQLMDFTPGYRLIHIEELDYESKNLSRYIKQNMPPLFDTIIPILANLSSDYTCLAVIDGKESIVKVLHDSDQIEIIHKDSTDFLQTLCAFYNEGVYFLDPQGFLDYDFIAEGAVGAKLNPQIKYWQE